MRHLLEVSEVKGAKMFELSDGSKRDVVKLILVADQQNLALLQYALADVERKTLVHPYVEVVKAGVIELYPAPDGLPIDIGAEYETDVRVGDGARIPSCPAPVKDHSQYPLVSSRGFEQRFEHRVHEA
jgi:hypothetical protein